jgi:hypothetical protein
MLAKKTLFHTLGFTENVLESSDLWLLAFFNASIFKGLLMSYVRSLYIRITSIEYIAYVYVSTYVPM